MAGEREQSRRSLATGPALQAWQGGARSIKLCRASHGGTQRAEQSLPIERRLSHTAAGRQMQGPPVLADIIVPPLQRTNGHPTVPTTLGSHGRSILAAKRQGSSACKTSASDCLPRRPAALRGDVSSHQSHRPPLHASRNTSQRSPTSNHVPSIGAVQVGWACTSLHCPAACAALPCKEPAAIRIIGQQDDGLAIGLALPCPPALLAAAPPAALARKRGAVMNCPPHRAGLTLSPTPR